MKFTVVLVDRSMRELKQIEVEHDLARKVGNAQVIQHEGKFYAYNTFRQLGSAEFRECDPPVEV